MKLSAYKPFLRTSAWIVFSFVSLLGCSDTNLSDQLSISSGGSPMAPPADTEAPTLSGVVVDSIDSNTDRSSTAQWGAASDNEGVSHYLISVAAENSSGTCDASDFASPIATNVQVPTGVDFIASGYQMVDGQLDGDSNPLSINLIGDTDYCTRVTAVDTSGNVSNAIYSNSPWSFLYESCYQAKTNEPASTDGVYRIDPDGVAGNPNYQVFCDMSTQGGGWTLVIRYDGNEADAANYFLPAGTGQSFVNLNDLQGLNGTGNLMASTDMVPFIQNGATMLMHVGKGNDAATDSSTYVYTYFSEIYQVVLDSPTNLFNVALDTNLGDGVAGTPVNGMSAVRKDQWFEADMSVMTVWDTDGNTANSYRIDGGEGDAMFTNGDREGALYCSGSTSNTAGHGNPKVQWGFAGNDGSAQSYGGTIHVGTHCASALSCGPANPINLMFIR